MMTWSVELKDNSWNDDTFNGTYEECIKYCEDNDYTIDGETARLAEIEVDANTGCVIYVYDIIEEV